MSKTIELPKISHADACLLSRVFNEASNLRVAEASRINEWLKGLIAYAGRCPTCHGSQQVNYERAAGWDERCPSCVDPKSETWRYM